MSLNTPRQSGKQPNAPTSIGNLWKKNAQPLAVCNWSDVDSQCIRAAIDAVTRAGGAIMLGITGDAGAFSVCVLHGEDKIKEYPHGKDECEKMLGALAEYFIDQLM